MQVALNYAYALVLFLQIDGGIMRRLAHTFPELDSLHIHCQSNSKVGINSRTCVQSPWLSSYRCYSCKKL